LENAVFVLSQVQAVVNRPAEEYFVWWWWLCCTYWSVCTLLVLLQLKYVAVVNLSPVFSSESIMASYCSLVRI